MRVLLTAYAERTTALPLVPLAWGLRTAGHDVLVASQPALTDLVTAAGLAAAPVGRDHEFWRVMHQVVGFRRDDPVPPFGTDLLHPEQVGWAALLEGYRQVVPWWWRLVNEPMLAGLVALCRRWRPDVVVWEANTYAGAVAARAVGAAHVRMVWTADVFARMRRRFLAARPAGESADPLRQWLAGCAARHGTDFAEELVTGQATVTYLPGPLRAVDPPGLRYLPVRYVPYGGRAVLPAWLREPPRRPRVCVTLGTTATDAFGAYGVSVGDVLAGLADLDVEVVATVPAAARAALGPVPGNARLVDFAPLDALLATCAAVVDHGGPGTVATALVHGVPQLVVPAEFDAPLLAHLLAGTGASLTLPAAAVTPAAVRAAVTRLLTDPAHRAAAGRLAAEARGMPTPHELADELHRLAPTPTRSAR